MTSMKATHDRLVAGMKSTASFKILTELWNDRENADFEIRCGHSSFKVHKLILRAYSIALARSCDNKSFQEGKSGILNLKSNPYQVKDHDPNEGDDPEIIEEVVHFFYHLQFSELRKVDEEVSAGSLLFLARVYVVADKYLISELKQFVVALFKQSMDVLREKTKATVAPCLIKEFDRFVRYVYTNPEEPPFQAQSLQTSLAQLLAELNGNRRFAHHLRYTEDEERKWACTRFQEWMKDMPELAYRVVLIQGNAINLA